MKITAYSQKDQFLADIEKFEHQISANIALRDHAEREGFLTDEMDALVASVVDPLVSAIALRKEALAALTTADHLRLAEQAQESMAFRETSTEEEEHIAAEIAFFRCKLLKEKGFEIPLLSTISQKTP